MGAAIKFLESCGAPTQEGLAYCRRISKQKWHQPAGAMEVPD